MKTKNIIYYILMFLPLAVTLAALQFLPDQIPAHYDFNNQVTRWGSKYESIIFPIFTVLFGFFMLGMAKLSARQEGSGANNEKVCVIAGIMVLILFNTETGYFLYTSFEKIENLSTAAVDLNQLVFGIVGIIMIVVGNIMPKARMNSFIGLRTRWSVKNEVVWKKSQRFGGITFIVGGNTIVIICFFVKGISCLLWAMGIFFILLAVDIYYTYKISKKI